MWFDGGGRRWREVGAHPRHVRLVRLARVERVGIHRRLVILARLHSDAVSSDGVLPGKPRFSCYFSPPASHLRLFFLGAVFVASETAKATVPCVSHSPRRLILSESQHDALSSVRETVYVREVLVIPPQSSARLPVVHHNGTQAPNSPAPQAHHGRSRRRQEVVQQAQQAGIALGPRRHGGASLQSFLGFSRKPYPRPAVSRTTQRVPRRSKFSKPSLDSPLDVPVHATRRSHPPSPASSTSSRRRRTRRWTRSNPVRGRARAAEHHRRGGEARGLELRGRLQPVSARVSPAAIRDGR